MLTDCLTCQNIDRCDQSDRWDGGCINYKMMPTKNPTNADKIRSMSDEELAVLLEGCVCPKSPCPDIDRDTPTDKKRCTECWLRWLRKEAES